MKNNLALIYNYAQHYRKGIFSLLDKNLNMDFYFGDKMADVKKLDYKELKNFKNELKNVKLFKSIYWQKGAIKLLFQKYDHYIILGEYYCLSTWIILILSKFSKKKIIFWTHGWYGNENKLKKIIKKLFFSLSDGVLLYGNYAKQLMINEGFQENKLHVIYNSLNYEKQLKIRKGLTKTTIFKDFFKNEFPVIIFIGRLTKVKKLNYLIDAQFNLIKEKFPVNIVFVGDGDEKKNLLNRVSELKLEKSVWFYGKCYKENEIGNLIFNADICVAPGNVGLTAMHAMVYGTPVITHNNFKNQMPEFEAIEKGVTGDFFEENSINDLVVKISDCLRNNPNKEFIQQKCFSKIDTYFNPNYQLKKIKEVLNEK